MLGLWAEVDLFFFLPYFVISNLQQIKHAFTVGERKKTTWPRPCSQAWEPREPKTKPAARHPACWIPISCLLFPVSSCATEMRASESNPSILGYLP